jgi:hypothetical protein
MLDAHSPAIRTHPQTHQSVLPACRCAATSPSQQQHSMPMSRCLLVSLAFHCRQDSKGDDKGEGTSTSGRDERGTLWVLTGAATL